MADQKDIPSPKTSHQQASSDTSGNELRYVNLYEAEDKVYIRKITGFYQNIRRYTGLPLIIAFLLIPWLIIDDRPAILLDIPSRQFHVLWVTFWPQDFKLLAWALIISAFMLFTVTVLFGRVWCGFTCPQTVWTLIFIYVERLCEGERNQRIRLDKQGWTAEKIARKSLKHGAWALIAFITGATFIGYFVPIRELLMGMLPHYNALGLLTVDGSVVAIFWTLFFTGMTYLNAGWMREQVCKYMCPYARFQSVMYDNDTLSVHYDKKRGEPRGGRKLDEDFQGKGLGECVDCGWCVQVCPVDIDIRDGMQFECINCGLCVDACNTVMDRMKYPRGLIRFTSEDQLQGGKTQFIRPRLLGYSALMIVMVLAFTYTLIMRKPVSVDVIRDRSVRLYRETPRHIFNVYTLKINNMDRRAHRFAVRVESDLPFTIKNMRPIELEEGEIFTVPVRVGIQKRNFPFTKVPIVFYVEAKDDNHLNAREETSFIGPRIP